VSYLALYSPSFLYPDNISVIASTPNTFTWQFNGNVQTDYQLMVYKNSDNTLVYNTGKINSSNQYHIVPSGVLVNGIAYKWRVTTYSNAFSANSNWTFFQANSLHTITISIPTIINTQNYVASFIYNQSEGIGLKQYRGLLYDNAATPNLIQDSDWIYISATPNQVINYKISGLVSGNSYKFQLLTKNQQDAEVDTDLYSFNVSYTYPDNIPEFTVNPNNNGSIKLSWTNLKQIFGTVTGSYTYIDGKFNKDIHLDLNGVLSYTEKIPEGFTIAFWLKLNSDFSGDFLRIGSDFSVGYDNTIGRFYYKNQYRITAGLPRILPTDYFLIAVSSNRLIAICQNYTEILV
jgi:hypothetical protein